MGWDCKERGLALSKSVEAFRNIGEVAAELGVKKHVLRFWEAKFTQLRPMKRGGGRRLYRPSDVELLRGIRDLLQDAGYTIKGVQKILRERGTEQVKATAEKHAAAKAKSAPRSDRQPSGAITAQPLLQPQLDGTQIAALKGVLSELKACHAMLAQAARGNEHGQP